MNSAADTLAGLMVGAYLLGVAINGNTAALIKLAERDKAFLRWGIALAILLYLRNLPDLQGPITLIIAMALIGLALLSGPRIAEQAGEFWKMIGE